MTPAVRQCLLGITLLAHALVSWASAQVQVDATASPMAAFVGQQVILTVSAMRPPGTAQGQLSEPQIQHATVSLLGAIEVDTELRNGIEYSVLRKRYAIVPTKDGNLTISGLRYQPTAVDAEQFTGGRGASRSLRAAVMGSAADIKLQVLAPLEVSEPWLPATELTLTDTWSKTPEALLIGDAVTRTVVVSAAGVPADRLPQIRMRDHDAYVLHADQPTLHTDYRSDGIYARRVQRFVLLLVEPVELPAIAVQWHDVAAGQRREARIGPVSLATSGPLAAPAVMQPEPEPEPVLIPAGLATGALVAFLVGAWLVKRWRTRHLRRAVSAVRLACRQHDARAVKSAVVGYGRLRWPDAVHLNLLDIGHRLGRDAAQALSELDRHLYGPATTWHGHACWQQLAVSLKQPEPPPSTHEPAGALTRLQTPRPAGESA